jgi:preprotein translocase subunit SecG
MLQTIVLAVHGVVAVLIILLVLLQRGKGAEAGTGFGAGASGTVFGARGSANFLSRTTGVLVAVFFATSMALTYLATQRKGPTSIVEQAGAAQTAPASLTPSAPPANAPSGGNESPASQSPSAGESPAANESPATGESSSSQKPSAPPGGSTDEHK